MAGSPGPGQAALAMGAGPARSGAQGLPIPPAPAQENGRYAEEPGPAPAAPACWARVDAAPLRSAQGLGLGLGLGRAVAVALPGAGGQADGLPAGGGGWAGGRAAAAPLRRWGSGSAACRGGAEPGLYLTPSSPASGQRPRPLRCAPRNQRPRRPRRVGLGRRGQISSGLS